MLLFEMASFVEPASWDPLRGGGRGTLPHFFINGLGHHLYSYSDKYPPLTKRGTKPHLSYLDVGCNFSGGSPTVSLIWRGEGGVKTTPLVSYCMSLRTGFYNLHTARGDALSGVPSVGVFRGEVASIFLPKLMEQP